MRYTNTRLLYLLYLIISYYLVFGLLAAVDDDVSNDILQEYRSYFQCQISIIVVCICSCDNRNSSLSTKPVVRLTLHSHLRTVCHHCLMYAVRVLSCLCYVGHCDRSYYVMHPVSCLYVYPMHSHDETEGFSMLITKTVCHRQVFYFPASPFQCSYFT